MEITVNGNTIDYTADEISETLLVCYAFGIDATTDEKDYEITYKKGNKTEKVNKTLKVKKGMEFNVKKHE